MADTVKSAHAYSTSTHPAAYWKQRRNIRLAVVLVLFGLLVGGSWYWDEKPAQVQKSIADVRVATGRTDVMTVEAVTEDGVSLVGRQISIVNARVTAVRNDRLFWVVGSEGDPLLVVDESPNTPGTPGFRKPVSGARVTLSGVVRDGANGERLSTEQRSELAKSGVYLFASDVQLVTRP